MVQAKRKPIYVEETQELPEVGLEIYSTTPVTPWSRYATSGWKQDSKYGGKYGQGSGFSDLKSKGR